MLLAEIISMSALSVNPIRPIKPTKVAWQASDWSFNACYFNGGGGQNWLDSWMVGPIIQVSAGDLKNGWPRLENYLLNCIRQVEGTSMEIIWLFSLSDGVERCEKLKHADLKLDWRLTFNVNYLFKYKSVNLSSSSPPSSSLTLSSSNLCHNYVGFG